MYVFIYIFSDIYYRKIKNIFKKKFLYEYRRYTMYILSIHILDIAEKLYIILNFICSI